MTVNDIGALISQYGFPIVACCALYYQNHRLAEMHKKEAEKWAETLSANTRAIDKLEAVIDKVISPGSV